MSDSWITLVPRETGFVPSEDRQKAGLALFNSIAHDAEEVVIVNHPSIKFFDCGENFESVSCPHCQSKLDMDWWSETMEEDTLDNASDGPFQLKAYTLPCCERQETLDKLVYEWPQAFGRFALDAMNTNIDALSVEQIADLEAALGCRLVVIYQHI